MLEGRTRLTLEQYVTAAAATLKCSTLAWIGASLCISLSLGCGQPSSDAAARGDDRPTEDRDDSEGDGEPRVARDASPPQEVPVRRDGTIFAESVLMGTKWSINVYVGPGTSSAGAGEAIQAAFDEVARIEAIASEWQEDSEVNALSRRAGTTMLPVSADLYALLDASVRIAEATDGAFDPTFHGVGRLWSFAPGASPPSDEQILAALPLIDYRAIELEPETRSARLLKRGMALGFGAIAKGYAVDRASKVLTDAGFPNHIVEGGGDTFVAGRKGEQLWQVGVQDPDSARGALGAIAAENEAIVSSGNYQRFFEHNGVKYSHIIDPRTGRPKPWDESPRSVTVLAKDAMTADAMCTAVAVMGAERGLAFVEGRSDLEAVIVAADNHIIISSGLRDRFRALAPKGDATAPTQGDTPQEQEPIKAPERP